MENLVPYCWQFKYLFGITYVSLDNHLFYIERPIQHGCTCVILKSSLEQGVLANQYADNVLIREDKMDNETSSSDQSTISHTYIYINIVIAFI